MCNVIVKPHIQWVTVALASGVKRPEPEANHSYHLLQMLRISAAVPAVFCMPFWQTQGQLYFFYLGCENEGYNQSLEKVYGWNSHLTVLCSYRLCVSFPDLVVS